MQAVLGFIQTYQTLFYLFFGVAFLLYLSRAAHAWQRLQDAVFGLEREQYETRLRRNVWGMGLTLLMSLVVFSVATYVAPYRSAVVLATPTVAVLTTPEDGTAASAPVALETPTPVPPPDVDTGGCVPEQVEISLPHAGDTLRGEVEIRGTALLPDFGFYKVDIAPIEQALFLTIFASHTPVKDGPLVEKWDTATIPPGEYVLQLVVADNEGNALPPCRLRIHIAPPE